MNLEKGFIVTTGDSTHKKIVSIDGNRIELSWYNYTGKESAFVSESKLKLVSKTDSKQYIEMRTRYEDSHKSFLRNENLKRQKRMELAKSSAPRKRSNFFTQKEK